MKRCFCAIVCFGLALLLSGCSASQRSKSSSLPIELADLIAQKRGVGAWDLAKTCVLSLRTQCSQDYSQSPIEFDEAKSEKQITLTRGGVYAAKPHLNVGPVWIAQRVDKDSVTRVHTYLARSFPADDAILACRRVSQLENLLGPSQGMRDGWGSLKAMHSSAMWEYFTLANEKVETLHVFVHTTASAQDRDARIDSLTLTRGSEQP